MTNQKERVCTDTYFRKDFPPPLVNLGYALLGLGCILILSGNFIVALILVLSGLFFGFTFSGVKIDFEHNQGKLYTSYFGWKKGTWESLESYPFISVLRSRSGYKSYNRYAPSITVFEDEVFDIYLLSADHRERFLLRSENNEDKAIKSAKELGEKLGVKYVIFHPVSSIRNRGR